MQGHARSLGADALNARALSFAGGTPGPLSKELQSGRRGVPTAVMSALAPALVALMCLLLSAPVAAADGSTHVVETITDISSYKREQTRAERLLKKLSDTNRDLQHSNEQLRDQSIRDRYFPPGGSRI